MTIGGIIRVVVPQIAVAIGSNIYGGRANTIMAALIIGTLSPFLSLKGYRRAPNGPTCERFHQQADRAGVARIATIHQN
jgi:hypothetical protein